MKKTPISTLEGKRILFIECVRKKIKIWYETMTPIPWKNSCKWTSSELFVSCGLILSGTGEELKVGNIDPDCKLQYSDIFTHDRLKSKTRIIIEGGPGSGKTMLLSQLAYDWSISNVRDVNIVIFLPLMFVKDMTIFEAIEKFYVPSDVPLNADDIERILKQASEENKAFILLDGLEVYNGKTKDGGPSEVVKVMKKEKLSNCRVVLSSCSDFEQDLFECPRLRLRQFSEEERDMYIGKVFPDNKEKQETFKTAIKNSAFLQDLCTSPLLFISVVHNIKYFVQYENSDQQERLGAFMQVLIESLRFHAHFDDKEQSQCQVQSERLSEIAFNGLCKGYRQLHWQKSFLDRTISDIKEWTESGILVAQDDLLVREEQQLKYQAETIKQISTRAFVDTGELVDALIWKKIESQRKSISGTSERKLYGLSDSEEELLGEEQGEVIPSRQSVYEGKVKQHQRKEKLDRENLLISKTSESEVIDVIGKGKLHRKDRILSSSSGIERKPLQHVSDQRKTVTSRLHQKETSSTHLHNVFLQIKFLHEIFQEWFAAIHISSMLKHLDEDGQRVFLNKHLHPIPADLHYVLQFTSCLCPGSCHLIMEHLLSVYNQADGAVPEYILNCIFLCFAEVDSSVREKRMDNAVRQVCKNTVTIQGEDSRLLQQSKVLMLTYASDAEIGIKHLKLVNVVAEISELVITFNTGITLPTLHHLQAIDVFRWDQKLLKEDYRNLIAFLSKCGSLEKAQLIFPNLPPEIPDRQLFLTTQQKMTVNWNIGKYVRYTLNMETETWKLEVRRPTSVSNTSEVSSTQVTVNENGGVVSIPETGVELEIPPCALTEGTLIRMRIIPHQYQDDRPLSFGSNSSAVVELLPSKLRLLKPAKLTLPHCLMLKKGMKWMARVFSSHHEEGKPPQWIEEKTTNSELKAKTCVVWLRSFSWKKIEVADGEIIEAKEILLYSARRMSSTETTVYVDVGYCMDLPRALEDAISTAKEEKVLLHHRPASFYKKGRLPLTIFFKKTKPNTWRCEDTENEISFREVASQKTDFCPFVFEKNDLKSGCNCTCYFKAGQEGTLKDLVFPLQKPSTVTITAESTKAGSSQPENRQNDQQKSISSQGAVSPSAVIDDGTVREGAVVESSSESQETGALPKLNGDESRPSENVPTLGLPVDDGTCRRPSLAVANLSKSPHPEDPPPENRQDEQQRSVSSQGASPDSVVVDYDNLRECGTSTVVEAASNSSEVTGLPSKTKKKKRKKKKARRSESSASSQKGAAAESSSELQETGTLPQLKADESRPPSNVLSLDLPVDDDTCRALRVKISREWKTLGRNLGFEGSQLDHFQMNNENNVAEVIYEMLKSWREMNGKAATFRALGTALDETGRRDFKDMVDEKASLCQEKTP